MSIEDQPLLSLRDRFVPRAVGKDDDLRRVVRFVVENPGLHDVCVVDDAGRLLGVVNIKRLFRTVFFHHVEPRLMTRHLMELASSETAAHLMVTDPLVAEATDTLGSAIATMVRHDLGELPVVDGERRLLGTLSLHMVFDLWLRPPDQGDA